MSNKILAVMVLTSLVTVLAGRALAEELPVPAEEPALALPAAEAAVEDPFAKGAPVAAAIEEAQILLQKQPQNMNLWVSLGNAYFDTEQPEKAIEAYGKALGLKPDQPNVLCDQAIMYRKVGAIDKAHTNFTKALALEPLHPQCSYNLGVLYVEDLKETAKGVALWERYLQSEPDSPAAPAIRENIEKLKKNP